MLEHGQQFGEFEIVAKLGHGGMGAVFKARQTVLRRLVAIKTLQTSLASDAEFVARFHNEAVTAAGLNHPNLVQVYAAGHTDGIHWFAMEFVDGESVDSRLKRLGKLEPAEAIAICLHVCTALEYAWRKAHLIHRDIKPDNIFLSKDGEVRLGDLGLAKSSDQQQGLTMTGASMGTPLYISPEQAEGRRHIDLRTDIYSLGATLYHLIAGVPPYTADSAISVMMKHVGAPVPDIRAIDSSIPPVLASVILRMMQKAPEERYASYEHLGADLQRAYASLSEPPAIPVQDAAVPRGEPSRVKVAKRGLPKWLAPAVAVPLVGLGAFALLKSKGQGPAKNASSVAQASTPAFSEKTATANTEAAPPPTEPVPAPPVQSSEQESQSNVDSSRERLKKLDANPLSVSGTDVLMSKTGVQGPGENASSVAQASTPAFSEKTAPAKAEAVPPPTKLLPALPVQNSGQESQSNVDSSRELLRKLEANLLPVPGTDVRMSKTEVTVGEWKAYLKAQKLPAWKAPLEFPQTDAHPVVGVSSTDAVNFCRWLSSVSGAAWRLPTHAEWDAASPSPFPWGESFPPLWNEGNYALGVNGYDDSTKIGADGIFGTAPVGSFKPNARGFYDLAGNVAEWVSDDGLDGKTVMLRGAGWMDPGPTSHRDVLRSKYRRTTAGPEGTSNRGFRLVRAQRPAQKVPFASASTVVPAAASKQASVLPQPPKGFRALFDGATLSGWHGLNSHEIEKAPASGKAALLQQQRADFPKYWRVENGELISTGTGPYATTLESFGNIDLLIEYKTGPKADSGIYLRGTPQIQIWDTTQSDTGDRRPSLGSGGLYNNAPGSPGRDPLVRADRPIGQWNQFRIRQVGARTWVWLNEMLVVDGALWEPFWDRTKPLPGKAPILLQTHGGEIRWRNIFVRDIPHAEAAEILKAWNGAHVEHNGETAKSPL